LRSYRREQPRHNAYALARMDYMSQLKKTRLKQAETRLGSATNSLLPERTKYLIQFYFAVNSFLSKRHKKFVAAGMSGSGSKRRCKLARQDQAQSASQGGLFSQS